MISVNYSVVCGEELSEFQAMNLIQKPEIKKAALQKREDSLIEVAFSERAEAIFFAETLKNESISFDFYGYSKGTDLPFLWKYRKETGKEKKLFGQLHGEAESDIDTVIPTQVLIDWVLKEHFLNKKALLLHLNDYLFSNVDFPSLETNQKS